ncbi:MAG: hypothetical protein U5J83_14360 [Bryobacterales bacterium]|nr:hypothetical protein [Bryobacterales bacterium]
MVNLILRSGRGKMMGVDQNKGLSWVGASAGFLCVEETESAQMPRTALKEASRVSQ